MMSRQCSLVCCENSYEVYAYSKRIESINSVQTHHCAIKLTIEDSWMVAAFYLCLDILLVSHSRTCACCCVPAVKKPCYVSWAMFWECLQERCNSVDYVNTALLTTRLRTCSGAQLGPEAFTRQENFWTKCLTPVKIENRVIRKSVNPRGTRKRGHEQATLYVTLCQSFERNV